MTAADLIGMLVAANLAGGVAVLSVLALRGPVRAFAGAHAAYASWLIVPAVMAAALLPARIVTRAVEQAPVVETSAPAIGPAVAVAPIGVADATLATPVEAVASQPVDWMMWVAIVWIAGAIVALASLMVRQTRAVRALGALTRLSEEASRSARAFVGPAVVGVLKPRIVLPADFEAVYEPAEQKVVIAHEEEHLRGRHTLVKTVVQVGLCLCWFNPLAYLASRGITMDQELACDEAVATRYPSDRRAYASALLKAQAGVRAPLGCYWPASSADQLKQRIGRLKLSAPSARRRIVGASVMAVLAAGAAVSAWAAKPPREHIRLIAPDAPVVASRADQPAPAPNPQPQVVTANGGQPQIIEGAPKIVPPEVPAGYDNTARVYLRGKVERIEFGQTAYTVFVRGVTVAAGMDGLQQADKALWKLQPTPFWGDRDAVNADLANKAIHIRGYRAIDRSCAPACGLYSTNILFPEENALASLSQTPAFGVTEFAVSYEYGHPTAVAGIVTRVEFGDRMFDAWVQAEGRGAAPGYLYQVRSEYRFPRADIEKTLRGKFVAVAGWTRKNRPQAICETNCGIYGVDYELVGGAKLTPAGAQLLSAPGFDKALVPTERGMPFVRPGTADRRSRYDFDVPVKITGKVIKVDPLEQRPVVWIETQTVEPANTPGAKPGTVWRMESFRTMSAPGDVRAWIGRAITATGFNARDTSCQQECAMAGDNVTVELR